MQPQSFVFGYDNPPEWFWEKVFNQDVKLILKNGIYDKNAKLDFDGVLYDSGTIIDEELFKAISKS